MHNQECCRTVITLTLSFVAQLRASRGDVEGYSKVTTAQDVHVLHPYKQHQSMLRYRSYKHQVY